LKLNVNARCFVEGMGRGCSVKSGDGAKEDGTRGARVASRQKAVQILQKAKKYS